MSARHQHKDGKLILGLAPSLVEEIDLTRFAIERIDPLNVADPEAMAQALEKLADRIDGAFDAIVIPALPVKSPENLVEELISNLDPDTKKDPRVAACLLFASRVSSSHDLEKIIHVLEDLDAKRETPLVKEGNINSIAFRSCPSIDKQIEVINRFGATSSLEVLSELIVSQPSIEVRSAIVAAVRNGAVARTLDIHEAVNLLTLLSDSSLAGSQTVSDRAQSGLHHLNQLFEKELVAKPSSQLLYKNGQIDPVRFIESNSLEDKIDAINRFAHLTDVRALSQIILSPQPVEVHQQMLFSIERAVHIGVLDISKAATLVWFYIDAKCNLGSKLDHTALYVFNALKKHSGSSGPNARMRNLIVLPKD